MARHFRCQGAWNVVAKAPGITSASRIPGIISAAANYWNQLHDPVDRVCRVGCPVVVPGRQAKFCRARSRVYRCRPRHQELVAKALGISCQVARNSLLSAGKRGTRLTPWLTTLRLFSFFCISIIIICSPRFHFPSAFSL